MPEVLMFCGLDELVADMVVHPDATHAKSEHAQRVLVIVGQRALADCVRRAENKRNQIKFNMTMQWCWENQKVLDFLKFSPVFLFQFGLK